jgi:hypothetical protein
MVKQLPDTYKVLGSEKIEVQYFYFLSICIVNIIDNYSFSITNILLNVIEH